MENMNTSSSLYSSVRWIAGLYFILQGCIQIDLIGELLFPNIHRVFVLNYKNYVDTIPWESVGLKGNADVLRGVIGYFLWLSGVLLVFNKCVKIFSFMVMLVGIWSVYAHISCGDPTYMAISGGLISFLMFCVWLTPNSVDSGEKMKSE